MPLFGPPNTEELKRKRDVKGLIEALSYKENAEVRKQAAKALGEIGDSQAVEPLIAALKDEARLYAAKALGEIGDPRAVDPLIAALKVESQWTREAAAEALGKIGDPRAVKPLIATAINRDEEWGWVCEAAARALVQIGAPAVEPLIAALKDENKDTRLCAAKALGLIGDSRALEPLIAALEDKDGEVQQAAICVLEKLQNPRAVEAVKECQRRREHGSFGSRSRAAIARWVKERQRRRENGSGHDSGEPGGINFGQVLVKCQRCGAVGLHLGAGIYLFRQPVLTCHDRGTDCNFQSASQLSVLQEMGGEQKMLEAIRGMLVRSPGFLETNSNARELLALVDRRLTNLR